MFMILAECRGGDYEPRLIEYANTETEAGVRVDLYQEAYGPLWHVWYEGIGQDADLGGRGKRERRFRTFAREIRKRGGHAYMQGKKWRIRPEFYCD